MKKRIIITGAGGLISNGIAAYVKRKDKTIEITGVSPFEGDVDNFDHIIVKKFNEALTLPHKKFDIIVHCAFDKENKSNELNTKGTIEWTKDAEKAGIKKHIFFSSISSQSEFLSPYGKSKKELEKFFADRGYLVFRLGLVMANGGMFGRLISSVWSSPVVPLISGGKFLVFPTDPTTIYDLVFRILKGENPGKPGEPINLQYKDGVTLSELLRELRDNLCRKVVFLPIPYSLIYPLVKIASLLKLPGLDIDTGNLKGLKWNSRLSLRSDVTKLGYKEKSLKELIGKLELQ